MINPNKKKYKFINNIWITGFYQGIEIIGRTIVINEVESVVFVDAYGQTATIKFNELVEIHKIVVTSNQPTFEEKVKRTQAEQAKFDNDLNGLLLSKNIGYN